MSAAEMFDKLAMECVERLRARLDLEHGWAPSVEAVRRIKVRKGDGSSELGQLCEVAKGGKSDVVAMPFDPRDAGKVALEIRRRGLVATQGARGELLVSCPPGAKSRRGGRAQSWLEPALVELRRARRRAVDASSDGKWSEASSEAKELSVRVEHWSNAAREMVLRARSK